MASAINGDVDPRPFLLSERQLLNLVIRSCKKDLSEATCRLYAHSLDQVTVNVHGDLTTVEADLVLNKNHLALLPTTFVGVILLFR